MARLVIVVDSETGELIDVAGNAREGGRYKKFAKRMLSTNKNPVLDYGVNGGDSLEISKGGSEGVKIELMANKVNIAGNLTVYDEPIEDIAYDSAEPLLSQIKGTTGQISVTKSYEDNKTYVNIALDGSISGLMDQINSSLPVIANMVSKGDIGRAVSGISVSESDGIDEIRQKFSLLLSNLRVIGGVPEPEPEEDDTEPEEDDTETT